MIYKCICGKEFITPNSFNGHKTHCRIHQIEKYGTDEFLISRHKTQCSNLINKSNEQHEFTILKKEHDLKKWISEQHTCEKCGKVMTEKFASGRFCSRSCANSHVRTEESKQRTQISSLNSGIKLHKKYKSKYETNPKFCPVCNEIIPYNNRHRKTCGSPKCISWLRHLGGMNSVQLQGEILRSKNEILFCSLCEKEFSHVLHNKVIFNGWDADVILPDYKLAILWNGVWHYKPIKYNQTLEQILNREEKRLEAIKNCGYNVYIIKDMGKANEEFVFEEFQKFKLYLQSGVPKLVTGSAL